MVIGHQKQWQFLKKSAELEKLSHAYLFAGPEKIGKRTLALEWVSLLFGENIKEKLHPDFYLITPGKPDSAKASTGKEEIQIAQIRDFIWKLSLKPYSAPFKVGMIDQAHLMTRDSQTCLLKTLEEPKGNTLLILITDSPNYLFPTILSRLQTVKFFPVRKEEIKNYLKKEGISDKQSEEILECSLGKPGNVIEIISNNKKIEFFQQKIKELNKITISPLAYRFQYAKNLSEEPTVLKETLDIWLDYYRSVLLAEIKEKKDFGKSSLSKIKNILEHIQTIKYLIFTTNINPKLALEILLMEL